jgi:hypothetical protein
MVCGEPRERRPLRTSRSPHLSASGHGARFRARDILPLTRRRGTRRGFPGGPRGHEPSNRRTRQTFGLGLASAGPSGEAAEPATPATGLRAEEERLRSPVVARGSPQGGMRRFGVREGAEIRGSPPPTTRGRGGCPEPEGRRRHGFSRRRTAGPPQPLVTAQRSGRWLRACITTLALCCTRNMHTRSASRQASAPDPAAYRAEPTPG